LRDANAAPEIPVDAFLNLPFDPRYERIYLALIAGLSGLGLTPRTVLELPPTRDRLTQLLRLIRSCSVSVHDLSCVSLSGPAPRCPRFNMPFELGLAVATSRLGPRHHWVVLESVRYRLQKSLSDLNGFEPYIHDGTPEGVLRALGDAFERENQPSEAQLLAQYRELRRVAARLPKDLFRPRAFRELVLAAQALVPTHHRGRLLARAKRGERTARQ
jgi:hypothetical protein